MRYPAALRVERLNFRHPVAKTLQRRGKVPTMREICPSDVDTDVTHRLCGRTKAVKRTRIRVCASPYPVPRAVSRGL